MTMKTSLFTMVSVCSALLAVNASGVSPGLINVDFAADPNNPKSGGAAFGQAGDYWNPMLCGQTTLNNLEWANQSPSSVGLTLSATATGCWGLGSSDSMYNGYTYPGPGQNMTVTLNNLPAGLYDLYVYGYDGNYEVATGGANYGPSLTRDWPISNPPVWQEGRQYARFWSVGIAGAGQPLTLTVQPGVDGYAVISGMQIAPAATEVWISPTGTANTGATGTQSDPFICPDGVSLQAVLTLLPPNITIHFNAGTPGFQVGYPGIAVKPGWKLRGQGVDQTILRLANNATQGPCRLSVVGGTSWATSVDDVEVSDLTVDCNAQNQSGSWEVVAAAVSLSGSRTRITNVKAINWGTTAGGQLECYPLQILQPASGATLSNCVIEYCEVTQPAPVGTFIATAIIMDSPVYLDGVLDQGISGGQVVYNNVHDITTSTSTVRTFHAYGASEWVAYNRASNILRGSGGSAPAGVYQDFLGDPSRWTSSNVPTNIWIYGNTLENVFYPIFFNKATGEGAAGVHIIGNTIQTSENGAGIWLYTYGTPSGWINECSIGLNSVIPYTGVQNADGLWTGDACQTSVSNNTLQGINPALHWDWRALVLPYSDIGNTNQAGNPVHPNYPASK